MQWKRELADLPEALSSDPDTYSKLLTNACSSSSKRSGSHGYLRAHILQTALVTHTQDSLWGQHPEGKVGQLNALVLTPPFGVLMSPPTLVAGTAVSWEVCCDKPQREGPIYRPYRGPLIEVGHRNTWFGEPRRKFGDPGGTRKKFGGKGAPERLSRTPRDGRDSEVSPTGPPLPVRCSHQEWLTRSSVAVQRTVPADR